MSNENERILIAPSTVSAPIRKQNTASTTADWLVPAALIALSLIPLVAGALRLAELASGAQVTPDNARFFAVPLPVVLHIVGASLFCILGAFQFAPRFRRRRPGWHRVVGRLLILCGLVASLSGLWMAQFYPLSLHLQGDLLYGFRLVFGSAMLVSIVLSMANIRQRKIAQHRAWIIRGYAIGQGAGTQALVGVPLFLIFGKPSELNNALMMGACWIMNLAVAEWIIRRNKSRGRS